MLCEGQQTPSTTVVSLDLSYACLKKGEKGSFDYPLKGTDPLFHALILFGLSKNLA